MKIISWNINGLRSLLKTNNLDDLINNEDPDIFCLSETKLTEPNGCKEELKNKLNSTYYSYWNLSKTRKGYSGTATFSKIEPINVMYGLNNSELDNNEEIDKSGLIDNEGRVITCEFKNFYLINVYTPNSGELLKRLDYRTQIWDVEFTNYIIELQKKKKVIVCGDLNVAHNEIDLKNPKSNLHTAGFTIEERNSFNNLLNKTQLIDTFRFLNKDLIKYSYWSYRFNSRNKNVGWRIDYFLISKKLEKKVIKSDILIDILGSDHAPVILIINLK
jgi:exodeoxyribonuclease-3